MPEDNALLNAGFIADVPEESGLELSLNEARMSSLAGDILRKFDEAKRNRERVESHWLSAYQNYRGVYNKNVKFTDHEKSRVFVKITKAKVLAAYGMLVDVVFGTSEFPIGVSATKVPEGIAEKAHLKVDGGNSIESPVPSAGIDAEAASPLPFDVGYNGDGNELPAGATHRSFAEFLRGLTESFTDNTGKVVLEEGPAPDPSIPQISPAKESAERLQKLIEDQIEESKGDTEIRHCLFEGALLGTGVLKGPYSYNKTLHIWEEDENGEREYKPVTVRVPRIEFVSCWDIYPDPHGTSVDDLDYIIQRRRLTRSEFRNLKRLPYFKDDAIEKCLMDGANYRPEDFENYIRSEDSNDTGDLYHSRFEVLEYWGTMDAESLKEIGVDVPDSIGPLDEMQANVWVCGDQVIRAVLNPFIPERIPYHVFNYETNPYSFWGVGVAENMSDSQQIMNGHARMAIDNLALAGSIVFDIDETSLVPGQSMQIFPGKIFRRQAGQPGQSIYAIKFPNTANENLMMFDKFRQLADEQTGIPSFSHGQTGVQSMTRTASGMSMLLGAASLNIKTVVKNVDDQLLKPLGDAFFQWNNQFYQGALGIHGDLEIVAKGTESLMQKEVRSQRITTFIQAASNPMIAPFVKVPYLVREFAKTLDLDPDEATNTPDEAAITAAILGQLGNGNQGSQGASASGQQPAGMGSPEEVLSQGDISGAADVGDGGITPPVPQAPGSPSFPA